MYILKNKNKEEYVYDICIILTTINDKNIATRFTLRQAKEIKKHYDRFRDFEIIEVDN